MPRPGSRGALPRTHLVAGTWPDGPVDGPPVAHYAREIARRLRDAVTASGLSLRRVAEGCDVDRQTISRVIAGEVMPDVATVAALEVGLDVDLWPGRTCAPREGAPGHRDDRGPS